MPRSATRFVGRDALVARVRELMASGGLVTLAGPPGIGKSRLASEVVAAEAERWVTVDAAGCADVHGLLAATERALKLPPQENGEARVARALAARELGLLLHGLEHLVDAAGPVLSGWLASERTLRLLVTTRIPLGLSEERVVTLDPLDTEGEDASAIELFVERARIMREGSYDPSPREREEIRRIVRRLEGIPLAIELTATRMAAVGAAELASHLGSVLTLSAEGPRDTKTLREAIEWSFRLLSSYERSALAQLSVFRSGFTLDAAEVVVDLTPFAGAPWMMTVLQRLVRSSLLRTRGMPEPLGERRFVWFESVRELAQEELRASGSLDAVEVRHRAWLLDRAEQWTRARAGNKGLEAAVRLSEEQADLAHWAEHARDPIERARFALAADAAGARHEERLIAAREALGTSAPALGARLALAIGRSRSIGGHHRSAATFFSDAREAARGCGERSVEGQALVELAQAFWRLGRVDACEVYVREAAAVAQAIDDSALEAWALRIESGVLLYRGELERARDLLEEALALQRKDDERLTIGVTLDRLGAVHQALGQYEAAAEAWRRALEYHRASGNLRWEGVTRCNLAELHVERGEDEAADRELRAAIDAHRRTGDQVTGTMVELQRALFVLVRGEVQAAHGIFDDMYNAALGAGHKQHASLTLGYRGVASLLREEWTRSIADLRRAEGFFASVQNRHVAGLFGAWAEAASGLGGDADALAALEARAAANDDPRLREVIDVLSALPRIGRARALAAFDFASARRELDAAQLGIGSGPGSFDLRAARTIATAFLDRTRRALGSMLEVEPTCAWFRGPDGSKVDMTRRRTLRRILRELVVARQTRPGTATSAEKLVEIGWPGERILENAARIRLRVALSTLRKLGLADIVLTAPGGYLLDPAVPVVIAEG